MLLSAFYHMQATITFNGISGFIMSMIMIMRDETCCFRPLTPFKSREGGRSQHYVSASC